MVPKTKIGVYLSLIQHAETRESIQCKTGLPLRGQRTKNNSRTRKGRRKTVANKKKVTK